MRVQEAARELGARYVVEGSVRRRGNRFRVTAQLIDAETGIHVWANSFNRESEDLFALQDEVVAAVVAQLTFSLVDAAVTKRRMAPTASLKAYEHVLRGRAAWRRAALKETLDHYLKAIEADPNYGTALACLTFFYSEDIYMQVTGMMVRKIPCAWREATARGQYLSMMVTPFSITWWHLHLSTWVNTIEPSTTSRWHFH